MRLSVLAERLAVAGAGHLAEHVAVEVERHDLPGVTVGQPDRLVRRHEQPARRAGMLRLADVIALSVEHLDARVVAVGDVEEPFGIEDERMWQVELARSLALLAPGLDEVAVTIELQNERLALAVALQHEQVAGRPDHGVVWLVEQPQMAVLV